MHKHIFVLSVLLLTSFGLHAASSSSSSNDQDRNDLGLSQEQIDHVDFDNDDNNLIKDHNDGDGIKIIKKDDENSDDTEASFSIVSWFKERTKTQLGGIFAGVGVGFYAIYKCIKAVLGTNEQHMQEEEIKPLVKGDHEILMAFSDAMIADVEHLKAGEEVAPSTELFDFSNMENERVMKEGEIVKRTFVYLYNECKESPEKVEALEGFTTTLKQDIVEMPVTA